jgi:hypothetical protein
VRARHPERVSTRPGQQGTRHATGVRHEGREALAAFAASHSRPPERYHKHCIVEPRIEIDGDEATAETYFLRLDEEDDARVIRSFGRYHDRLVRCPDGRWRFRERIAEIESP